MHLSTILLPLFSALTFGGAAEACAKYRSCKCHDSGNDLQNDAVTEAACKSYSKDVAGGVSYNVDPHHQCGTNKDLGGDVIDNCEWDKKCKESGQQYYQWCWDKDGIFS